MGETERAGVPGTFELHRAVDHSAVLFYGLVALLIFAPLFRAGNRPLPLLIMELLALALLAWRFWRSPTEGLPLSRMTWMFLALLFLLPPVFFHLYLFFFFF